MEKVAPTEIDSQRSRGTQMLKKTKLKGGQYCRVTFSIVGENEVRDVRLMGEFNEWNDGANPLKRRKDGQFSTSLTLPAGRDYRFRYLLNGEVWRNDESADDYLPNPFGTEDSVVRL